MSKWAVGTIEKQLKERPTLSVATYAIAGLAAMSATTPTGALISLAGAVMGALVTAVPTKLNYKMSKRVARAHIGVSAVVGALMPFGAVAYGAYQTFKVAKLFSRRSESGRSVAPAAIKSQDSANKPK